MVAPVVAPALDEGLDPAELRATVDTIVAAQHPDGSIPWFAGHHTDPWNLVEAAMALDVGGRHREAERAYEWLRSMQRPDGAWHAYYQGRATKDPTIDTNVTCYVATGVRHHHRRTGDTGFLEQLWPVVERAIDFALSFQSGTGEIAWCADDPSRAALLTGCSSIHSSLRDAIAIAEHLGHERRDWELSLASLATAIAAGPERFLDKARWAMDWYYPVLGGVWHGDAAREHLASRWSEFVVPERGVRCVADRPWVTAAETCELVMALDSVGLAEEARDLFAAVQFLRTDEGGYWTGMNFEDERFDEPGGLFPVEQSTWSAAAVVLAADALGEVPSSASRPTVAETRGVS
jgi:hypothetical protein